MHASILIERIVRQTTILIAQLSTATGIRAPLAHIADQVFIELSREIESQGVSRKVCKPIDSSSAHPYVRQDDPRGCPVLVQDVNATCADADGGT